MNSKNQMTVPHDLQFFSKSTVLICLAHDRAKVYEANNNTLRQIAFWHTPKTDFRYSDKESFMHAEGSQSIFFKPGTEEHNKEHYLRVFLNYFHKCLQELHQQYHFDVLYLFLPNDMKNITFEKIPHDLQAKAHLIPGNVMHEHPLDLLKRIEQTQNV